MPLLFFEVPTLESPIIPPV